MSKENLPGDFLENALTDLKDRGSLMWATPNFYFIISAVEQILDEHFERTSYKPRISFHGSTDIQTANLYCFDIGTT